MDAIAPLRKTDWMAHAQNLAGGRSVTVSQFQLCMPDELAEALPIERLTAVDATRQFVGTHMVEVVARGKDRVRRKPPVVGLVGVVPRVTRGDGVACCMENAAVSSGGLGLGLADEVLDLEEGHPDRVRAWAVGREEDDTTPPPLVCWILQKNEFLGVLSVSERVC